MNKEYLTIYNNLIKLTRNKSLYLNLNNDETFSDRITFLLINFSFFLKNFKNRESKVFFQKIHDFTFKQIEINLRETGYGDTDENGIIDIIVIDKNENKIYEFTFIDTDEDGNANIGEYDKDEDGNIDVIAYDYDQDGEWDKFENT